jgi:hypothetical protein
MRALKCGNSDNFVKREKTPDKLIKVKIKTTPREIKDLLRVRWRKKRRAKRRDSQAPHIFNIYPKFGSEERAEEDGDLQNKNSGAKSGKRPMQLILFTGKHE